MPMHCALIWLKVWGETWFHGQVVNTFVLWSLKFGNSTYGHLPPPPPLSLPFPLLPPSSPLSPLPSPSPLSPLPSPFPPPLVWCRCKWSHHSCRDWQPDEGPGWECPWVQDQRDDQGGGHRREWNRGVQRVCESEFLWCRVVAIPIVSYMWLGWEVGWRM